MNTKEDKDNDDVTKGIKKAPATTNKKQRYIRRHDNNHHSSSATDFVGETPEIDGILC